jgi:DnaJ like chaperone protein
MQLRRTSPLLRLLGTHALAGVRYRLVAAREPLPAPPAAAEAAASRITPADHDFRHLSFTFALIGLSAHVACAGGRVTRAQYVAFREAFPLSGGLCGKLRRLFSLACESPLPVEHYVHLVKYLFPRRMELFLSLTGRLFRIACADGSLNPASERVLSRVAHLLGISAAEYTALREQQLSAPAPHEVLGVARRAPPALLKKHYHRLMRTYHPDRHAATPLSPELDLLLRLKTSEINEAYHQLTR